MTTAAAIDRVVRHAIVLEFTAFEPKPPNSVQRRPPYVPD